MRFLAVLVVAAACGDGSTTTLIDADGGVTLTLQAVHAEPAERAAPAVATAVWIDGVQGDLASFEYPGRDVALATPHTLELRAAGVVLATHHVDARDFDCLQEVPDAKMAGAAYCVYESGDIRFADDRAGGMNSGFCIGDGFCRAECYPLQPGCGAGQHCSSRVTSRAPFASHLGCVPVGARALHETCALIDDAAGAYDDCADGLLCVEGTCEALCVPDFGDVSHLIPGHAPELALCP